MFLYQCIILFWCITLCFGTDAVVFASNQAVFGQGTGPIHMRSVGCNQKSLKLIQCNYDGRTTGDYHWEDAGLRCTASGKR